MCLLFSSEVLLGASNQSPRGMPCRIQDSVYWPDFVRRQVSLPEIMKQMRLRDANGTVLLHPSVVTRADTDTLGADTQHFWLSFSGAVFWLPPGAACLTRSHSVFSNNCIVRTCSSLRYVSRFCDRSEQGTLLVNEKRPASACPCWLL
jgi:hypothetical protein